MEYINFAMLNIWYHRLQLLTPVVMGWVCAGEVALDLKQNTWPLDLLIDICKFMYPLCVQVHTMSLCTQQWGSTLTKSVLFHCTGNLQIKGIVVQTLTTYKVDHTHSYDNNLSISV